MTSCDLPVADCDDADPQINPGNRGSCAITRITTATPWCDEGFDEDVDGDGDGVDGCDLPAPDCDDGDPL